MKRLYTYVIFTIIFGSWLNLAPAQNVVFPDANLANKVREALNLPAGAVIPEAQLATLTDLDAGATEDAALEAKIRDLTGLEHATQLEWLYLDSNEISDITPLAGLTQLMELVLDANEIVDINPLTGLTELKVLSFGWWETGGNQISDITPLATLTNLTYLSLWGNQISDITPLTGLTALTYLDLASNQIDDISPLAELTQLTQLLLDFNEISDVAPLTGLVNLETLFLEGNPITDTAPLHTLLDQNSDLEIDIIESNDEVPSTADPAAEWMPDPNLRAAARSSLGLLPGDILTQEALQGLTVVFILDYEISDLTGLEHATQLKRLHLLGDLIFGNPIVDLSPLSGLTNLTDLFMSRGVIVDLSPLSGLTNLTDLNLRSNSVVDVSPLAGLTNLSSLDLGSNAVVDISPLAGLTNLSSLDLGSNAVVDISPLAGLTNLQRLIIQDNQITDISPLAGLTNLGYLNIENNPIEDVSALQTLLNQVPDLALSTGISSIWSVSFSPDGTLLAIGTVSGIVQLLDVATGEIIAMLDAHTDDLKSVSFSPDGMLLASGSYDGTVRLWDVATREIIATLQGHTQRVNTVSFSPDGRLLATGAADGIKLWDVNTNENIDTLSTGFVNAVLFSPDGTLLVSGEGERFSDGSVKLWDLKTKETLILTEGHDATRVSSLSFSRDGKLLAVAALHTTTVWDMVTKEIVGTFSGNFNSVSLSPDGTLLATGSTGTSSTVRLWDVNTKETIAELKGHTAGILVVAFSPDGTLLAMGPDDGGGAKLWDMDVLTRQLVKISGDAQQGTFGTELPKPLVVELMDRHNNLLPDVEVTFTVTEGDGKLSGQFTVAHATTDANGRASFPFTLGNAVINTVGVSVDGRKLLTFEAIGISPYQIATFEGGFGAVVSFSPDGTLLAIGDIAGTVQLWDVATKENIATLEGYDWIVSMSFSPDSTRLAIGALVFVEDEVEDTIVRVLDVATRETIATLDGFIVLFSPDGTRLATVDAEGTVKVSDVATQETITTLEGHTDFVTSVSFSPDGTLLATADAEGTVKLWDVATRETIATLEGNFVLFSPDGTRLATTTETEDGGVKLWDVATKENISVLELYANGSIPLVFSPDGTLLLLTLGNGVGFWEMKDQSIAFFEGHCRLSGL